MKSLKEKVSIITLNYNKKQYLKFLLDSLSGQSYKNFEVILVDNNSSDGSVEFVRKKYPKIIIVKNKKNLGFAGGNNSALSYCRGGLIALINNDMVADKYWLENMHNSMQKNDADVVGSKIIFYKPFITLKFKINTFIPKENNLGNDKRELGCMISSDISIKDVNYDKKLFLQNTYSEESRGGTNYHWISDGGIIKLPIEKKLNRYVLNFMAKVSDYQREEKLKIYLGEELVFDDIINNKFKEYNIDIKKKLVLDNSCNVINNAGSEYNKKTGNGKDIGINEDDSGQYDKVKVAKSLCGGSMLIKGEIIDKYGFFDSYFFAYYEDTDFCWRLRNAGKKLIYEPSALVKHIHAGTSTEWSPFFYYHVCRNRLAMVLKNGKLKHALQQWAIFLFNTFLEVKNKNYKKIIANTKIVFDLLLHFIPLIIKRIKVKHIIKK